MQYSVKIVLVAMGLAIIALGFATLHAQARQAVPQTAIISTAGA